MSVCDYATSSCPPRHRSKSLPLRRLRCRCGWLLPLLLLTAAEMGCRRPPRLAAPDDAGSAATRIDPWDNTLRQLRKEHSFAVCRVVLQNLNHELAADESLRSTAFSEEALERLQRVVPLDPSDREELRSASFTPQDAAYLADCFYLRDAARQIVLPELTARQKAERVFAWVCRHVWLHPWLVSTERGVIATALPPTAVLRRGTGSGLERMYVFLALLQQLGLDGCLLGPPDAVEHRAGHVALSGDQVLTGSPRGPFWAVGVRLDDDILLFDPWRGLPFPATLRALRTEPNAYKDWFASALPSGLTIEALPTAAVYLAAPLNALTPRMRLLQEKLGEPLAAQFAVDVEQLRQRFAAWQPRFWNPPQDRFAYGRASRTFLPTDHGGTETGPVGQRLFDLYYLSQLPPVAQVIPAELRQNAALVRDVGERLAQAARSHYAVRFLEPPTPRERIQRGQFQEAARLLVSLQDEFGRGLSRIRNTADADRLRRDWIARAAELYERVGRDPDALARIEQHWREEAAALLLDQAVSEVGQAEATFLLALCQHEQAERVQLRFEHAPAADVGRLKQDALQAWQTAARAWRTYRGQYAAFHAAMAGRAPLADLLAERAERLARP